MGPVQTFEKFLASQSAQIPVWGFIINLILAAALAFVMSRMYVKYGRALSNRRDFAKNFVLLAMTTMLIISIVKSSLALSLGMVGALSIVRFRAAIKEPEELAYLFLSIAIGLGLGADQRIVTVVGFLIIIAIIYARSMLGKSQEDHNLYLTVNSHNPKKAELSEIVDILNKYCSTVNLKRFDETKEVLEASFFVEFENFSRLEESKTDLEKLGESVRITFLDSKGLVGVN
jgi:uncharacterized membrane protein YhiD involved in acid resistance